MKKLLTLVTAVAMLSSVASAQLLKNFKYNGSLEVNAYNVNNADFNDNLNDKYGNVDARLMLDMGFDLNNDVDAKITIIKDKRQWGTSSEHLNTIEDQLFFEQAYVNLKGVLGMDHKLGRQFYGNPHDFVIYYGPNTWPYSVKYGVSSIDAFVPTYKYNDWRFTGLLGKEVGGNNNMGINVSGIDVKTKIDRFNLNAYYYYKVANSTSSPSDKLGVLGFRLNWEGMFVKELNLGIELDKNMGIDNNNKKYKGNALKINADYSMNLAGKFGLSGEYAFLSGEDTSTSVDIEEYNPINSDYRPGIIYGGFGLDGTYLSSTGSGLKVMKIGANWTPEMLNKLNLAFDYINFKVDKVNSGKKDLIGNEYDIVATWKHSDNVHLKGYYAMFKPEKDNTTAPLLGDDNYTALGAAFVVKF